MLNYKIITFLVLLSLTAQGVVEADFNVSNGLDIMESIGINFDEPASVTKKKLSLLKENFQAHLPSKTKYQEAPIIPKVIHQIWLGKNPIPKNYQYYASTWKKFHPTWEYKLWTEKDIVNENFGSMDLYYLAGSYQERADIIRYEILKKYGGVYVDTDIECLSSYDELNHKYDFFAGMESPVINKFVVSIPNSLIGSIPGHPVIEKTIEDLRKNWYVAEKKFEKKYSLSRNLFLRSPHFLAVQRSMYPFTNSIFTYLESNSNNNLIILPSGYNTPIYFVDKNPLKNKLRKIAAKNVKLTSEVIIQPETMSFQHYGKEYNSNYNSNANFDERLYELNTLEKIEIKKVKEKDKYYLSFKDQFNKNFPIDNVSYQPEAIIPEVIYIYSKNLDLLDNKNLEEIVLKWKKKNRFFSINTVDLVALKEAIPDKFRELPNEIIEKIAPFYLLNAKGGVFVQVSEEPLDLQEFNYKFALYGKFASSNDFHEHLRIRTDFLAFINNHILITNFLNKLEEVIASQQKISQEEIDKLYIDSFYKYNQLDGKNVIFPASVVNQKITKWIIQ